jgi:hypothetical protein
LGSIAITTTVARLIIFFISFLLFYFQMALDLLPIIMKFLFFLFSLLSLLFEYFVFQVSPIILFLISIFQAAQEPTSRAFIYLFTLELAFITYVSLIPQVPVFQFSIFLLVLL